MRVLLKRGLVILILVILLIAFIIISLYGFIGPKNEYSSYITFPRLSFDEPIGFEQPSQDKSRNYVYQKNGLVYSFENSQFTNDKELFLNLTSKVTKYSNEDGFLGMAFHPDFEENGIFYTFHSEPRNLKYDVNCSLGDKEDFCVRTVLSEFKVDPENRLHADSTTQRELLEINQTGGFHRAGQLNFGPDGYLYLQIGDGTKGMVSQDLSNIYGSIIRIDVDHQDSGLEYAIPADNPFVGMNNTRGEIWAYGLRNPWRGSFDPLTGDLWVGDVGADDFEEVDVIRPGYNYGWPIMEGNTCRGGGSCDTTNFTEPVVAYPHGGREIEDLTDPLGIATIGGHVYRGEDLADLVGKFILVDYIGTAWSIEFNPDTHELINSQYLNRFPDLLSSVSVDENGELIFVGIYQGKLFKLVQAGTLIFYGFIFLYTLTLGVIIYRWTRKNKAIDTVSKDIQR